MKVIDLLNKIAKGEEVPKTLIYDKDTYTYNCECCDYIGNREKNWLFDDFSIPAIINDEVEVIEEDKKIEKIPKKDKNGDIYLYSSEGLEIIDKINEIIDKINKGSK